LIGCTAVAFDVDSGFIFRRPFGVVRHFRRFDRNSRVGFVRLFWFGAIGGFGFFDRRGAYGVARFGRRFFDLIRGVFHAVYVGFKVRNAVADFQVVAAKVKGIVAVYVAAEVTAFHKNAHVARHSAFFYAKVWKLAGGFHPAVPHCSASGFVVNGDRRVTWRPAFAVGNVTIFDKTAVPVAHANPATVFARLITFRRFHPFVYNDRCFAGDRIRATDPKVRYVAVRKLPAFDYNPAVVAIVAAWIGAIDCVIRETTHFTVTQENGAFVRRTNKNTVRVRPIFFRAADFTL